ncbi:hypothetical protein HanHA89_Chr17g0692921 [Helianthus annuus]|nr:hypothetical protein HanHA89_Chr17g0692921 [Helianthus annuus]
MDFSLIRGIVQPANLVFQCCVGNLICNRRCIMLYYFLDYNINTLRTFLLVSLNYNIG